MRERGGDYYRREGDREERGEVAQQVKMLQSSLAAVGSGAASTLLARQQRNGRRYDVPQIGEYSLHT